MRGRIVALAPLLALCACVGGPTVVASRRSPDNRLVARLIRDDTGASRHLLLDVGLADAGPFITIADLADRSEPFALRWRGPVELDARLPCAPTTLRGQLEQQVRLPDTSSPVTVRLTRPASCKLPLDQMR